MHFVLFSCIYGRLVAYETRCETGRTSANVRARKSHQNFSQQRTRSTPLDPKLTLWRVSYHLGAFGTTWLLYKTRCTTDRSSAKGRATKSRQNFSQETHMIHPIGPKTDVLMCFVLFGCMRGCLLAYETRCETGRTSAKVSATKSRPNFSQRTHPNHPIRP